MTQLYISYTPDLTINNNLYTKIVNTSYYFDSEENVA